MYTKLDQLRKQTTFDKHMENACFHCHEPILDKDLPSFEYQNNRLSFCCYGCASICEEVIRYGNFDYYQKRTAISLKPDESMFAEKNTTNESVNWLNSSTESDDESKEYASFTAKFNHRYLDNIKVYDDDVLLKKYVKIIQPDDNDDINETLYQCDFDVYDMTCAACAWLIQKCLSKDTSIKRIALNYSDESLSVTWSADAYSVSDIISKVQGIGYKIIPHEKQGNNLFQVNQKKLLKRLGITALFTMQIMTLSVSLYAGEYQGMDIEFQILMQKASMILSLPIIIFGAQPFFLSAWRSLKNRHLNMDVPISIAVILAFCTSVVHTIKNSQISENLTNHISESASNISPPKLSDVYFDSISMLIFFLLLSRYFEAKAKRHSNDRIRKLAEITPLYANRYKNEIFNDNTSSADEFIHSLATKDIEKIASERLQVNDIVLLKRGETLAADGKLLSQSACFNQSVVTGESNDITYQQNDTIVAGSINTQNDAIIQCLQVGEQTSLHKINQLAKNSQQQKTSISLHVDTIARYFTIGLLTIAAFSAYYWYQHEPDRWIEITLAILVVTCPCALSLATPVSVATAISAMLDRGILLKDVGALNTLSKVNHIIFDKTGTLTEGKLTLQQLINFTQQDNPSVNEPISKKPVHRQLHNDEILALLAGLEKNASHAIAAAIKHKVNDITPLTLNVDQSHHGVMATHNGTAYYFGNRQFIIENTNITEAQFQKLLTTITQLSVEDKTKNDAFTQTDTLVPGNIAVLTSEHDIIAACLFTDNLKSDSASLIDKLHQQHYDMTLLSGDNPTTVNNVAKALHIDNVYAEQSPSDKLNHIRQLQKTGNVTMMVGDGINDAPVLAASNVSIAVKDATNYAIAESDLVLINTNMSRVTSALVVAKKTNRVIKQNLTWSLMYNIMTVPAAVMGYVHPLVAAIGMSLSSLLVVVNALRILKK